MRWHSLTPGMTSNSMGSTSPTGPTPPSTVCTIPEERWTMKPIETNRSMTFCVCASSAPSCITTSMSFQYSEDTNILGDQPVPCGALSHCPGSSYNRYLQKPDAIIIGAGHNGLVCAAYLAQ